MNLLQKYIFIFFLFIFSPSQGQDYKFDIIVKSKFPNEYHPNQEFTNLFNSNEKSYFMQVFFRNDSIKARIFDVKESVVHHFFVKDQVKMDFEWLKTEKLLNQDENYSFEFSDMKTRKEKHSINFYTTDKTLRRTGKLKLTVKETDQNLFRLFTIASLEPVFFKEIVPPSNFMVLKAKGTNYSGNFINYELTSINAIDLSITIPRKDH